MLLLSRPRSKFKLSSAALARQYSGLDGARMNLRELSSYFISLHAPTNQRNPPASYPKTTCPRWSPPPPSPYSQIKNKSPLLNSLLQNPAPLCPSRTIPTYYSISTCCHLSFHCHLHPHFHISTITTLQSGSNKVMKSKAKCNVPVPRGPIVNVNVLLQAFSNESCCSLSFRRN
jgi:hypothetical protein